MKLPINSCPYKRLHATLVMIKSMTNLMRHLNLRPWEIETTSDNAQKSQESVKEETLLTD